MTTFHQHGEPNTGFENKTKPHLVRVVHVTVKSLGHVSLHAAKLDYGGKTTALDLQQPPIKSTLRTLDCVPFMKINYFYRFLADTFPPHTQMKTTGPG